MTRPPILHDRKIVDHKHVRRILLDDHAIKRPLCRRLVFNGLGRVDKGDFQYR